MCGIAGWVGFGDPAGAVVAVRSALAAMVHRGPDDAGLLVYDPARGAGSTMDRDDAARTLAFAPARERIAACVLGSRRLAILDPSPAGHQPMLTPDGRWALVFNGEIYNHVELRAELEAAGCRFRSRCDTEVLLAALSVWGEPALGRLEGMYAFAALDLERARVLLARDPFGMKPLYYALDRDGFFFASEIGALLRATGMPAAVDRGRLHTYLSEGLADHGDRTLFAGIRSLPAAHCCEVSLADPLRIRPRPLPPAQPPPVARITFADASAMLREEFLDSVRKHLRSDQRVGTMLSGGLDSSSIVMAIREVLGPDLEIHTFSYIGEDGAVSEEPWIDVVNRAAGAIPHKVKLRPEEWCSELATLARSQEHPCPSLAIYAQHRLFREARDQGVRVVLDGQGSDEIFAGYRLLWAARLADQLRHGRVGEAIRWGAMVRRVRGSNDPTPLGALRGALTLLAGDRLTNAARRRLKRLPWIDADLAPESGDGPGASPSRSVMHREMRRRQEGGSLAALLRYEDRNSMFHSVEARLPYLLPRLQALAFAVPDEFLIDRNGATKALLRSAMRGIVPDEILDRRDKIGFAVPMRAWLARANDLPELLEDAARLPGVSRAWIREKSAQARSGRGVTVREGFALWRLAGLGAWARAFDVRG